MGRITTPTYRAEIDTVKLATGARQTDTVIWRGRVSAAICDDYAVSFHESTLPGGCNAHLGILLVREVRVIRQSDSRLVACSTPSPMFQVVA